MSTTSKYEDMQLMIQEMLTASLGPCYLKGVNVEAKYDLQNKYEMSSSPPFHCTMTIKIDFSDNKGVISAIDNWRAAKEGINKEPDLVTEIIDEPVMKRIVGDEGSW